MYLNMITNDLSKPEHNIMNIWIYGIRDIRESVHTWFTLSVLERESMAGFWDSWEDWFLEWRKHLFSLLINWFLGLLQAWLQVELCTGCLWCGWSGLFMVSIGLQHFDSTSQSCRQVFAQVSNSVTLPKTKTNLKTPNFE